MSDPEKERLLENAKSLTAERDKLKSKTETQTEEKRSDNRRLDALRRLVQIATAVVMALLVILWFMEHPDLVSHDTKQPILGGLFIVCLAYIAALEVARGSKSVVIFLVLSGMSISSFALGYAAHALRHYLS